MKEGELERLEGTGVPKKRPEEPNKAKQNKQKSKNLSPRCLVENDTPTKDIKDPAQMQPIDSDFP